MSDFDLDNKIKNIRDSINKKNPNIELSKIEKELKEIKKEIQSYKKSINNKLSISSNPNNEEIISAKKILELNENAEEIRKSILELNKEKKKIK